MVVVLEVLVWVVVVLEVQGWVMVVVLEVQGWVMVVVLGVLVLLADPELLVVELLGVLG
jgi:hypothetical protein